MKDLSFYDQAGIVVPGSVVLFGGLYLLPELRSTFVGKDAISVGGLGLFLILAYGLGHVVAAAANAVEQIVWLPAGGMPSTWPTKPHSKLLNDHQKERLRQQLQARLGITLNAIAGQKRDEWQSHFMLLYRDVLQTNAAGRIETFNGLYGLSRGLATATLSLACAVLVKDIEQWRAAALLGGLSAAFTYRMWRFGVHFAREVFFRFLLLPAQRP